MKHSRKIKELKYRIPVIYIFIVIVLIIIASWTIGSITGLIPIKDILLSFIGFINMLIAITMLSVVGAIFLGMYLSHRMLTKKGFTPFEISMLEMHEDIKEMNKRLEKLETKLNDKNNKK